MSSTGDDNKKLIILRMAHEILHNKYLEHKTRVHNEWALAAATLWRTQGTKLAYPALPPYPSEDAVVAAASVLLAFVGESGQQSEQSDVHDIIPVSESQENHTLEILNQHLTIPEELIEPQIDLEQNSVAEVTVADPGPSVSEDTEKSRLGLIPSWLLRSNR